MKAHDSQLSLAGSIVRDSDGHPWGFWSLAPAMTQHEKRLAGVGRVDRTRQDFAWLMPPTGHYSQDLALALVDVATATIVKVVR